MQCHLINFFRKYAMERGAGRSGKWPAAFSGLFPLLVPWLNILSAKLNDIEARGLFFRCHQLMELFFLLHRFLIKARSSSTNKRLISSLIRLIFRLCFLSQRLTASYRITPFPNGSG